MSQDNPPQDYVRILIDDYVLLHDAYSFRDQIVWQQFVAIVTLFTVLTGFVVVVNSLLIARGLVMVIELVLGTIGFLAILAVSTDMASNSSCKIAVRKKAEELEEEIRNRIDDQVVKKLAFSMWKEVIFRRKKFSEEKILKGPPIWEKHEKETEIYLWVTRTMEFLWLALITTLVLGEILLVLPIS